MQRPAISVTARWAGRIITALVVLFLLFDGVTKAIRLPDVVAAIAEVGYGANQVAGIGIVLLACTVIYLIPRSAILGAILLTGYLGGATATTLRIEQGLFPLVFAVAFGVLVWLGLYLRDPRLRELVPLRRNGD